MARRVSPLAIPLLILATSACVLASSRSLAASNSTSSDSSSDGTTVALDHAPCATDPNCGQPASKFWYQLHGWLMWGGFGILMPAGIITARHFQTDSKAWFHIHLSFMFLGISSVVGGGVIAFLKFEAIPKTPLTEHCAVHVYMGLVVFSAACLNFLLGLFRPHKGNLPRVFWFASHFTFGTCAVALAWYVVFTGLDAFALNWEVDVTLYKLVFGVQIAVLGFLYLFLGRWDYLMSQKDKVPRLDGITSFNCCGKTAVASHTGEEGDEDLTLASYEEHKIQGERDAAFA